MQNLHIHQEKSIALLLAGKDTMAIMPAGSGKSLIFQTVGIISEKITVVFSPLKAIMIDQGN